MNLKEIAEKIGANIYCADGTRNLDSVEINAIKPLQDAGEGDLSFITSARWFHLVKDKVSERLRIGEITAVIVGKEDPEMGSIQLVHNDPRKAMALTSQLFHKVEHSQTGVSEQAWIHQAAKIESGAIIYPYAFIDDGAEVKKGVVIYPFVSIGKGCIVDEGTVIYSSAVLMYGTKVGKRCIIHGGAVLGGDGFGFTPSSDGMVKIPQVGHVVIEDDVEIGPLATIDRAAFDKTIVRRGCKLDSQVHIGHNVDLGEHSMLCGQVGIAGSTKIGRRFIAAGQSGIGPSLEICDSVVLGPQTGLVKSVTEPGEYMGLPPLPMKQWRRNAVSLQKITELNKKVRDLEQKMEALMKSM